MISTECVAVGSPTSRSGTTAASTSAKIRRDHQDRLAMVYVRQSTPQQVQEHRESTALQYNLRQRALDWGWPSKRVLVVDEDQAKTAATAEGRIGFHRLLAEVALDHVGLILGIDMSRLARSNKDWHYLLEVCAVFGTILSDLDGVYDPRDYNDRLLLGLKGTLSEAELHMIRQRMYEGRLNKARRGELFNAAPVGYVRSATGDLALDPDEQVQAVVRLIFDQFDTLGTINAVLQYLVRNDIRIPVRPHSGPNRGKLEWRRPNRQTLRNLLHHPLYAGAYTWGRRLIDPRRKVPGRPWTGRTVVPPERCLVFLKDRCPAYITWPRYEANQRQIADNQARAQRLGAVREGSALLAGLLVCGQCGCRMMVHYDRPQAGQPRDMTRPRYTCRRHATEYAKPLCQSITGRVLDELVGRQILALLEPATLELSLTAAADIERERATADRQWQQRLERAHYETDRARRQYDVVEPENRLVTRELERQWEEHLLEQRTLEDEHDRFRQSQPTSLSDADRQLIRALSADLPRLWHSPKTSWADRQTVVRQLIGRVVVTASVHSQHADVSIHWAGGYTSQHALVRPVARYDQLDNFEELMGLVLELRGKKLTSAQIAEQLNREGFCPLKRRATFDGQMVRTLLSRQGRTGKRPKAMESRVFASNEWWFSDLARHLQMSKDTLYNWLRRGWVHGRQLSVAGGRWILWADADEADRLRKLRRCPRSWHSRHQAATLTQPKPQPAT